MECKLCGLSTHGDRCGNPGCKSNALSQFECKVCGTISPGPVCSNPGCKKLERNQYQGLGWGQLLSILDSVTVLFIKENKEEPKILNEFVPRQGLFRSIQCPKGKNWLWLCSAKSGPKLTWIPAKIQIVQDGFDVWVLPRELNSIDARVHFPNFFDRTDLRYFEIGLIFKQIGNDSKVASEILARMQTGKRSCIFPGNYDGFIDGMIVLLFGIESSRNWSTCATSLMLLELIANERVYGKQQNKDFKMETAFHHPWKRWNESTYYGGKHPMATHGTGYGNLIDRGKIVKSKGLGWDAVVSSDPQRHAVIYRELRVLMHWLQFTEGISDYEELSVKERILKLLNTYYT